jgi:hypothetical protein
MVFGWSGPKLGLERRPGLQQWLFLYSAFTLRFLATDFSTGTITVSLNHAFPVSLHCTALIFGHSYSLSTYHYSFHSPFPGHCSAGLGFLLYSLGADPTENTASNNPTIVVMGGCLAIDWILFPQEHVYQPLPSSDHCLQSHCLATGLYATIWIN